MSYTFPFVSIVIPVHNGSTSIGALLDSLHKQTYSADRFEIIVVDNNSTDTTAEIVSTYHNVILLSESQQSSYAARNTGIAAAKGDVIACIDADCIADSRWIEQGVQSMKEQQVDIVAGRVQFFFSQKPTAAELWDALVNMDQKYSVEQKQMAATANLFFVKEAYHRIGAFNTRIQSGGDVEWTVRAVQGGYCLRYCENAFVSHPARTLIPLLQKYIRVGTGTIQAWKRRKKHPAWMMLVTVGFLFVPVDFFLLPKIIRRNGDHTRSYPYIRIGIVAYLCRVATVVGIVKEIFARVLKR